jgi:integrase
MASIFKRGGKKAPRDAPWMISYSVRPGVRKTVQGCRDYEATKALARKLEADAMLRREGVVDERAEQWAAAEVEPLSGHVADFAAALRDKGSTDKHVETTEHHVRRIVKLAGAERISDLAPSRVQAALAALRGDGLSLATCNHAMRAIKGFSRWLWRDARAREDALAHLRGFNAARDRRRERRALSEAELAKLIRAAECGPTIKGMAGRDRAALYALASETGFRAGELRSLTPESFSLDYDLDAEPPQPPTVAVEAAYSKRKRRDVQPIRPDLADRLRVWLADKPAGRPVFDMPRRQAEMLRADLEAAGVPYRDAAGRVADFHALRHCYISRIVASGASVKVCQELARHSTPALTIGLYAHADLAAKVDALEALRPIGRTAHGTAPMLPEASQHDAERRQDDLDNLGRDGVSSRVGVGTCDAACRNLPASATKPERWLSGLKRRIANPVKG